MSGCHLSIHLDRENGVFLPGERVEGEVVVEAGEAIGCSDLTLERRWETQGAGDTDRGEPMKQSLGAGKWPAGTQRFRFNVPVPAGPVSYAGTLVSVKWLLRARADIAWARDPKCELEFTVRPPPARELSQGSSYRSAPKKRLPDDLSLGPKFEPPKRIEPPTVAADIVGSMLCVALGYGFWRLFWGWFICSAGFVLFGLILFVQSLWKWVAWRKIGVPRVSIAPNIVRAGDPMHVALVLAPHSAGTLDEVTVELKCEEIAVKGAGDDKLTRTHGCHTDSRTLVSNERITKGKQVALETRITVPEGAPPTFAAENNKVEWSITVLVSVRNWPDWKGQYPIAVYPA